MSCCSGWAAAAAQAAACEDHWQAAPPQATEARVADKPGPQVTSATSSGTYSIHLGIQRWMDSSRPHCAWIPGGPDSVSQRKRPRPRARSAWPSVPEDIVAGAAAHGGDATINCERLISTHSLHTPHFTTHIHHTFAHTFTYFTCVSSETSGRPFKGPPERGRSPHVLLNMHIHLT